MWIGVAPRYFVSIGLTTAPDAQKRLLAFYGSLHQSLEASPQYDATSATGTQPATKTYKVPAILGFPYEELVSINGKPLSAEQSAKRERCAPLTSCLSTVHGYCSGKTGKTTRFTTEGSSRSLR